MGLLLDRCPLVFSQSAVVHQPTALRHPLGGVTWRQNAMTPQFRLFCVTMLVVVLSLYVEFFL